MINLSKQQPLSTKRLEPLTVAAGSLSFRFPPSPTAERECSTPPARRPGGNTSPASVFRPTTAPDLHQRPPPSREKGMRRPLSLGETRPPRGITVADHLTLADSGVWGGRGTRVGSSHGSASCSKLPTMAPLVNELPKGWSLPKHVSSACTRFDEIYERDRREVRH